MTLYYPPKGVIIMSFFSLSLSTPMISHTLMSYDTIPPLPTLYLLLLVNHFILLLFCLLFKNSKSNWLIPWQEWLVMTKRFSFFLDQNGNGLGWSSNILPPLFLAKWFILYISYISFAWEVYTYILDCGMIIWQRMYSFSVWRIPYDLIHSMVLFQC